MACTCSTAALKTGGPGRGRLSLVVPGTLRRLLQLADEFAALADGRHPRAQRAAISTAASSRVISPASTLAPRSFRKAVTRSILRA